MYARVGICIRTCMCICITYMSLPLFPALPPSLSLALSRSRSPPLHAPLPVARSRFLALLLSRSLTLSLSLSRSLSLNLSPSPPLLLSGSHTPRIVGTHMNIPYTFVHLLVHIYAHRRGHQLQSTVNLSLERTRYREITQTINEKKLHQQFICIKRFFRNSGVT